MLSFVQLGGGEDQSLELILALATVVGIKQTLTAEHTRLDVVNLIVPVDLDGDLESLRSILDVLLGHDPAELSHRNMEGLNGAILTEFSLSLVLGLENVEINHSNYLPDQDLVRVLGKFVVLYSGTTTCLVLPFSYYYSPT